MWLVAIPPRIAVCPTNERALFGNLDNMAFEFEARILTTLKLDKLQSFQRDVLSALLKRRGVFVSIKTGIGKSLCYQTCILLRPRPGVYAPVYMFSHHPGAMYVCFEMNFIQNINIPNNLPLSSFIWSTFLTIDMTCEICISDLKFIHTKRLYANDASVGWELRHSRA